MTAPLGNLGLDLSQSPRRNELELNVTEHALSSFYCLVMISKNLPVFHAFHK